MHLVYPPHCLGCKTYGRRSPLAGGLCPSCQTLIQPNIPPFCPKCARPLHGHPLRPRCLRCQQKEPRFDFAWAACLYAEPLKTFIHQFKYNQKTSLRVPFAELMISFIHTYQLDMAQFQLMIPVPLFPTRLRERGYNQSYLLAQGLAKAFAIELSAHHLIRVRHTRPQFLLDEKERWTNMHRAFKIKSSCAVSKKNILLIDDLLTTGATASEAAAVLKEAGAQTVGVLTLAITY